MSDDDDTTTNAPQHRADAPVDGGSATTASTGDAATGDAATTDAPAAPAPTTDAAEPESGAERPEHGLGDLNVDTAHPFDQTNGIVEGLEGDSDFDDPESVNDTESNG